MNFVKNKNWCNEKFLFSIYIIVCFIITILPSKKDFPPIQIVTIQLFLTSICVFTVHLCKGKKLSQITFLIFTLNLIASVILRLFYIDFFNNPLGYIPIDSAEYNRYAVRTCEMSLTEYINCIKELDIDDRGIQTILYIVYHICGATLGINIMIVVNSIFTTISSYYLYKLSSFFLPNKLVVVITALWGTMPFSITTSADGLKENFFSLFLVVGVYYAYAFFKNGKSNYLVKALLFGSCTVFFRLAVLPIFMLCLFVIYLNVKIKSTKNFYTVVVVLLIISSFIFKFVFNYLMQLRGFTDDTFAAMHEHQYGTSNVSNVSFFNWIFGIIGSFPSFRSSPDKVMYITVSNFSPFVTLMTSSFYLYGMIIAIKKRSEVLPLVVVTLLNTIMIIMMSFSFDFRYRFVQMPFVLMLAGYGLYTMNKAFFKFHILYQILLSCIIILYNVL